MTGAEPIPVETLLETGSFSGHLLPDLSNDSNQKQRVKQKALMK